MMFSWWVGGWLLCLLNVSLCKACFADVASATLRKAIARNRKLREHLDAMRADMRNLASEEMGMHVELLELRAVANGESVIPLGRRN
jgi:hypothetical protein